MSNEAINWAFAQPVKHSTAKFVLVALANHASDGDWLAWPSVVSLTEATGQDRKTVLENLKRLTAMGYISDTGTRKGVTKQVPVYRLNRDPKPVEQSQKRDDSENGTVPKFPDNSTVFPIKQSQNSVETVPKTGHGTIRNHQGTIKEPSEVRRTTGTRLTADWIPSLADARFCETERPDLRIDDVAARFRDYWTSKSGKDATKVDWSATWRNWVRNERRQIGASGSAGSDKFRVANLDHSSSRAAMEASIRKHGITVPEGEIEF
jgi:hypothetical protein